MRWRAPVRVGLAYALFGVAWILLSDTVVLGLAPDLGQVRFYELAKGIVFVLLSALLVVVLLDREQRTLRQREAQFRGTFENASVGITHIGPDRHWLEVNQRFCDLLGYTKAELQHLTFDDVTVAEDREADATGFAELIAGRRGAYRLEKRYQRKDGSIVWASVNRSLQRSGDGVYCISVVVDITARRLAEAAMRDSEERFRLAVESAHLVAWEYSPRTGELSWSNPDSSWGFGTQVRITLEQFLERVHPDDRNRVRQAANRALEPSGRGAYTADYRLLRPDGTYRWISARGQTFFGMVDGVHQAIRALGVSADITEQKELERQLYFFKYLTERSQDPFYVMSPAEGLRFTYLNPAACRHFGRSEQELLMQPAAQRYAQDASGVLAALTNTIRERKSALLEVLHRHADGHEIPVELSANYFVYGGQELIGGYFRDITERKAAEAAIRESESRFRTLADNISQLAWMASGHGEIFWYNQRWYDFTGMAPQEMENQGWKRTVHPDHLEELIGRMRHCFATGEVLEATFPMRRYDGEYRWFLTRAVPIRDEQGNVYRWFGTNTDVTDELNARKALDEANQAKDRFLAVLSHELRTPLTPVIATLSALDQEPGIPDALRDELRVIQRNVELEARLIDDLLDLTRVARGKVMLDRRPVNLCTVLDHVAEVCAQDIEARELHFGIKCMPNPIIIEGDPARLQQVFWNLVKNATKFTSRGGCIGLKTRLEDGYGVVEIADSGQGIAPEMLPRIFDAFEQGGYETTRQHGGLGLGLAICKTMVELHGGSIEAQSDGVGKGARFIVRLPVLRGAEPGAAEQQIAPRPRRRAGHAGLNVLLVEDHGDTARILRRVLSAHGHHVQTAGDVATAIRATHEHEFDVIVSDLGLPDGSGLDVVEDVRRAGKTVPAIAMSGYGQEEDIRRSREAGFNEHLVKPVDVRRLEEAIDRAVAEREWRGEA